MIKRNLFICHTKQVSQKPRMLLFFTTVDNALMKQAFKISTYVCLGDFHANTHIF